MNDLESLYCKADGFFPENPDEVLRLVERGLVDLGSSPVDGDIWGRFVILKANALIHLGRLDEAESLLDEHEATVSELENKRPFVDLKNLRSMFSQRRADYVEAILHLRDGLTIARTLEDKAVPANLASNMGLDLMYLGDFSDALGMFEESLRLWQQAGDKNGLAATYLNIGLVSSKMGNSRNGVTYYEKALEQLDAYPDKQIEVTIRVNIASYFLELKEFERAREEALKAFDVATEINDEFQFARATEALAEVDVMEGNWKSAEVYLSNALDIYEKLGNTHGTSLVSRKLSDNPNLDYDSRHLLLRRAVDSAKKAKILPDQSKALECLAELEEEKGDFEAAFRHLKEARMIETEKFKNDALRSADLLRVKNEVNLIRDELEKEKSKSTEMVQLLDEVKEARSRAEEESRQKSELLGHSAHDLRGLTAGIFSLLELYEDEENQTAKDEYVEGAKVATDHLLNLLQRLIDKSAIEEGKVSIELKPFSLNDVIERVDERWSARAKEKGQDFQVVLESKIEVFADPLRLEQILINLVSNASKYTQPKKAIGIRVEEEADCVEVIVWDEGPGINREDQDLLFKPFQRLSAQPTGGEFSTGLGLNIVKELSVLQGISVSYRDHEGGGSEFCLKIPLSKKSANN